MCKPRINTLAVYFVNGMAAARINAEITKQQIGSAIVVPKTFMHKDDIITATLPSASAKTCKKTPYIFSS